MTTFMKLALLFLSCPVGAESRDQRLLREMAEIGARTFAEERVRGYLDHVAAERTAAGGVRLAPRAGTAFIFAVDIGLSIHDYSKAKSDKDRGFAVVNGLAGAVAVANPLAGLISKGALAAIKLIDVSLSAKHVQQLARIYRHIEDLEAQMTRDLERIERSERARIQWMADSLTVGLKNIETGSAYLTATCVDGPALNNLNGIDDCLKSLIQVTAEIKRLADLGRLMSKSKYLIFQDAEEFTKTYETAWLDARSNIEEILPNYSQRTAAALRETPSLQQRVRGIKLRCSSDARRLALSSIALRTKFLNSAIPLTWYEAKIDEGQMRERIREFYASPCVALGETETDVDDLFEASSQMLRNAIQRLEVAP